MSKKPFRIIIISTLGFIIGIFNIFIFVNNGNDSFFFVIGSVCILLSLGLFKLWNWARIMTIISSWIFIFLYLGLVIYTVKGVDYHRGFAGIGLIFNFPLLVFCIWALDYLSRRKTKELFTYKEK